MECMNLLTTISVRQKCHSAWLPQAISLSQRESSFMVTLTYDTAPSVLFRYESWAGRRMMWNQRLFFFSDVTSSVQPHLPNTVLSKMSFWGEIHISPQRPSVYPASDVGRYSISLAGGAGIRHASGPKAAHTPGDSAPGAPRKTIKDMKTRKWTGTGKLPKEGQIESMQTNHHVCI